MSLTSTKGTKRWAGVAFLCVIGGLLACVACSGSDPAKPHGSVAQRVRARVADAAADGFSGAALVAIEDEHVLVGGYGMADREQRVANTPETAFDVGSILKDFTAAALFKLADEGALALSDPLSEIFADVPADKAHITLLQILQHRAGFQEYHDVSGDFEPMTQSAARQRIFAQELLFAPGSDEAYSNAGFTLLADVVQTVSKKPFTEYVTSALFAPAGMQQSGFYSDARWQTLKTAIGYDAKRFGENDPATWPYTWALIGNGGLVTTVLDLERWSLAFWDGRVLSADAVAAMRDDYLSLGSTTLKGHTIYAQAGAGDFGLGGAAVDIPDLHTRIILATNTFEVFDIEELARELALLVLDAE